MYSAIFVRMTPRTTYTDLLQSTGWSLREWARRSGVSINTLRKLSGGQNQTPQRRTRLALAAALTNAADDFRQKARQLEA